MFDGGPGGARGAPPAIDQVTAEVKAPGGHIVVDKDVDEVVSARPVPTVWNHMVPSGAAGFIAEVLPVSRQSGAVAPQFFT